jgi:hypothetical protein
MATVRIWKLGTTLAYVRFEDFMAVRMMMFFWVFGAKTQKNIINISLIESAAFKIHVV